jgi:hypothetical protein
MQRKCTNDAYIYQKNVNTPHNGIKIRSDIVASAISDSLRIGGHDAIYRRNYRDSHGRDCLFRRRRWFRHYARLRRPR